MPEDPLTADDIRRVLLEVANVLPTTGPRHVVIVIGGSLLAWHGLRDTTADVDSVKCLENPLRVAVAEVAKRHDLAAGCLNDFAAGFVPATLSEEECPVLIERPPCWCSAHRCSRCSL